MNPAVLGGGRSREFREDLAGNQIVPNNGQYANPSFRESDDVVNPVSTFKITFERADATYNEGEEMRGRITLEMTEGMVFDELSVEFTGTATLTRQKQRRRRRDKDGESVADDINTEQHLNQRLVIYKNVEHDLEVSAGRHSYQYRLQLPYNLPSSIIGDYGDVRYRAKATIHRPWQSPISTTEEFHIGSILDLNKIQRITLPVNCQKTSQPSSVWLSCCYSHEHFVMVWRLDRTGYIPGEKIRINGEIHNNGKMRIRKSTALLIQHLEYYEGWQERVVERKSVALVEKGAIDSGCIGFWREDLEVPPLPPTGLKGCSIISLWYTLKLKVYPRRLLKSLETSIEITIGTIPLNPMASTPIMPPEVTIARHSGNSPITTNDYRADVGDDTQWVTGGEFNYFV